MHKVVIIGSGPAGLTAALYTARANLSPLLIDGSQPGGQLTLTTDVENYPGFPKGILGPQLIQDMRAQAERFETTFRHGHVTKIDLQQHPFQLVLDGEETIQSETLIIATGSFGELIRAAFRIPAYGTWCLNLCHLRRLLFPRKGNRCGWWGR